MTISRPTKDDVFELLDIKKKDKDPNWLSRFMNDISKASAAKQLTVGGISGWCAGFAFSKVGKVAATAIGGSLLLVQIAQHQGYVKVNWTRVNKDVEKAKRKIEKEAQAKIPLILEESQNFIQNNIYLAGGFAGGFLLGLASS